MDKKIGFIGAGNMGGALLTAAAKSVAPSQLIVTDSDMEKAKQAAERVGCALAADNNEVVQNAEYIVLAVKPNVLQDVVKALAPALEECVQRGARRVLVSIAAGVAIKTVKDLLRVDVPVIRVMPNTPAMVGQGMLLLCTGAGSPANASAGLLNEFRAMLAAAGRFDVVDESAMDITGGVSGCTPAYVYMFIEALADGAVQTGVPRALAMRYAAQAVLGAAAMVLETGAHPGALKDMVCSPGGSTIVGVATLEQHGFRNAVMQAVVRSTEKNCQLGK